MVVYRWKSGRPQETDTGVRGDMAVDTETDTGVDSTSFDIVPTPEDLASLSKKELLELASRMGVDIAEGATKKEILAALKEVMNA